MQVVDSVVGAQRIGLALQIKRCVGNAVTHAADERTHAAAVGGVGLRVVKTQVHVAKFPFAVGHQNVGDHAAEIENGNGCAARIGQCVFGYGKAVLLQTERLYGNAHGISSSLWLCADEYSRAGRLAGAARLPLSGTPLRTQDA